MHFREAAAGRGSRNPNHQEKCFTVPSKCGAFNLEGINQALSCGTTRCISDNYNALRKLQDRATGDDSKALVLAGQQLLGEAQVMGSCVAGTNCAFPTAGAGMAAVRVYGALGEVVQPSIPTEVSRGLSKHGGFFQFRKTELVGEFGQQLGTLVKETLQPS